MKNLLTHGCCFCARDHGCIRAVPNTWRDRNIQHQVVPATREALVRSHPGRSMRLL